MTARRIALPLLLVLIAAPVPAAPPTEQEIRQAVEQLGDKRFAVREKASKFLWNAGPAAELALKKAAQSTDAETSRRAKAILDKFDYGIFPDTPKELSA